jgi:hypothetical protein
MPVTGLYMSSRVNNSVTPYLKAYAQCVLEDIVPAFANLSKRSDAIADAEFRRLGELPAGENFDGDMSDAAEAAQDKGQAYYNTMVSIRQSSLNLFSAGLFHLLEQQLTDLCRDGAFDTAPPDDTQLSKITAWFRSNFHLDLSKLPAWSKIEQLRLLANSVKHGEGNSAAKLRVVRPDIFQDPQIRDYFPDILYLSTSQGVHLPLAGEDIFVTTQVFEEFSQAANAFVEEIAEYFDSHKEEHYFAGG